jgi:hypothetical protein
LRPMKFDETVGSHLSTRSSDLPTNVALSDTLSLFSASVDNS